MNVGNPLNKNPKTLAFHPCPPFYLYFTKEVSMKNRIREFRFFLGMTLDDLWLKTKISQSKLSRIERGIFEPTRREKVLIAEALSESPDRVFPK
jgi:hypothetical protein